MGTKELDKYEEHYRMLARKFRYAILGIITTLGALALHLHNSAKPDYECHEATVIVQQYQTLWGIASELCTGEVSKAVDDLVDKYGTTIHAGQAIILPIDGEAKQ